MKNFLSSVLIDIGPSIQGFKRKTLFEKLLVLALLILLPLLLKNSDSSWSFLLSPMIFVIVVILHTNENVADSKKPIYINSNLLNKIEREITYASFINEKITAIFKIGSHASRPCLQGNMIWEMTCKNVTKVPLSFRRNIATFSSYPSDQTPNYKIISVKLTTEDGETKLLEKKKHYILSVDDDKRTDQDYQQQVFFCLMDGNHIKSKESITIKYQLTNIELALKDVQLLSVMDYPCEEFVAQITIDSDIKLRRDLSFMDTYAHEVKTNKGENKNSYNISKSNLLPGQGILFEIDVEEASKPTTKANS